MKHNKSYNTVSFSDTVLLFPAPASNMYDLHEDSLELRVKYTSPKPYLLLLFSLFLHLLCRLLSLPPDPVLPLLEDVSQVCDVFLYVHVCTGS